MSSWVTFAYRDLLLNSTCINRARGLGRALEKPRVITLYSDSQRLNSSCPFEETKSIFYYMAIYGLICHIDIVVTFPKFSNHMFLTVILKDHLEEYIVLIF